jgi:predicted O-methyltransferase YrrM
MRFDEIPTAWRGHEAFADWLVRTLRPSTIVDLGVDFGFSTIAFARPNIGTVYGVDWFQGDACAGQRDAEEQCRENLRDAGVENVELIRADFSELAKTAKFSWPYAEIDILHIDGDHSYEAVSRDFREWLPKVRNGGVILLHDTQSFPNDVGRFFREIDELPKFEFPHASGLGVITCR